MSTINKTCRQCQAQFEVMDSDLEFYDKVSPVYGNKKMLIPPPTLCTDCRQIRRLTWRGEKKLYHRGCDLCKKPMVTIFRPENGYTVYCRDCFWSDNWSPLDHGKDFDFSRPFFEQFDELIRSTPLVSAYLIEPENSDYNNNASFIKNCYLLTSSNRSQDCYYGYFVNDSANCIDCTSIKRCELCYECTECIDCYNCLYSFGSVGCSDSWFLENCISCKDCFGCVNLQQKQYCFFNEQLTREDYEAKMKSFKSGDRRTLAVIKKKMSEFRLKFPFKFMIGNKNENVTGNCVFESQNAENCYDCINVQDCKNCYQFQDGKDCMDVMSWGKSGELFYECMASGNNGYNNSFSAINMSGINNSYTYMCLNSKNVFGSVSLKNEEYCVFNKKYSPQEYENLVVKIIEHMKNTGEYGEFFPTSLSPLAYNESVANEFHPLTKEIALRLGYKWKDEDSVNNFQGPKVVIAEDIQTVSADITKKILSCEECFANYKIIDHEFDFLVKKNLPAPTTCHLCRHKNRLHLKNPRHLWERNCSNCNTQIQTTYSPDRPEKVVCEKCYLELVY